jgi:hypothetical protein
VRFGKGDGTALYHSYIMSSLFHPQTDGQTERVNQTLDTSMQHFVSVELHDWGTPLSRAEFAHKSTSPSDRPRLSLTSAITPGLRWVW